MNRNEREFQAGQAALQDSIRAQLADLPTGHGGDPALRGSDKYPNAHLAPSYRVGYPALQALMTLPAEIGTPLSDEPHAVRAFEEKLVRVNRMVPTDQIPKAASDEQRLGMGPLCILAVGRVGAATIEAALSQIDSSRQDYVHGNCLVSAYCPVLRTPRNRPRAEEAPGTPPLLQVSSTLNAIRKHIANMPSDAAEGSPPTKRKQ